MPMSQYQEAAILNQMFNQTSYTPPTTIYLGLSSQGVSGATDSSLLAAEPTTAGSYARVAITNNATNFPNATSSTPTLKNLATTQTFTTSTGSGWTYTGSFLVTFMFCDASTVQGGHVIWYGSLSPSTTTVTASGITLSFAGNAIQISLL
jgi:hypothetical protein